MDTLLTIKPELLHFSLAQAKETAPFGWLLIGVILLMVFSCIQSLKPKLTIFLGGLVVLAAVFCSSVARVHLEPMTMFNGMLLLDPYTFFFCAVFAVCAGFTFLASYAYLEKENLQLPEYYLLILFSVFGMMLMSAAVDTIMIFISLELMSLAVYTLVGFRRADRRSNEAAMKYFILGGIASAVFLYGSALLYGATGTTRIDKIMQIVHASDSSMSGLFLLGAWLTVCGFLFKVASVPFHMWMPDVYEGAPTPVTAFMTTGVKAASFAVLVRLFVFMGFGKGLVDHLQTHIHHILWICAVLTMVIGNVIALTQTNLKRMLAYSSIAHTGYLLVGIIAAPRAEYGFSPILIYLVAYILMNMGAFIVLTLLSKKSDGGLNLHDLSGVSEKYPALAFAMSVFLFSMAGIPPTAGFAAKYFIFYSAVQAGEIPLTVIGVLCSAISVYYYLRVMVYMYMKEPVNLEKQKSSLLAKLALATMVILTIQVGVMPKNLVAVTKKVVTSL